MPPRIGKFRFIPQASFIPPPSPRNYKRVSVAHRKSFTLIELLIVIAIVAILSTVVIITLNPAELLRQSRDSVRLSDLSLMN
ncbi:MAG TPA: prepilin-type N-terminal cleavage/methylation domain-containing protein, partial [Candidatus Paceibacterota bacterium]